MKRFIFIFAAGLCFLIMPLTAENIPFRAITAVQGIRFSNDRYVCEIDNTFAAAFTPRFTAELKNSFIKTDYGERYSIQPGCIWLINKNVYVETVFGPFIDNENKFYWDGYSEVVSETVRTIFSACFRAGFVPSADVFFCIPNTSFLYQFTPLYASKLKYYFGFSTDNFLSHTLSLENIFTFKRNTFAVLTSGRIEEASDTTGYAWSAGLRYERRLTSEFVLKCTAEYLQEPQNIWGVNGICTVDVKF
jgi:hypothetical protein